MDILVIGAGVVGSQYAARLRQAGHMVSLLARGQRAAELRQHGIVLEAVNTGQVETVHVMVTEHLDAEERYEWVIVALRSNQLESLLPALAAHPGTPNILFIGNNPAGAAKYVQVLGRERVALGFGSVGGLRRDGVVRYYRRPGAVYGRTYLGELDGRMTPRLAALSRALAEARLPAVAVSDMDAWLKTHAALISPLALAIYAAGGDNYRLARTPDGLLLALRAVREGLAVLRDLNVPVLPPALGAVSWLPEPLLLLYLRGLMNTRAGEIGLAGHANAARDEMRQVADDFYTLVRAAGRPAPALDQLRAYLDPQREPLAPGSASLPVDMRAVWAGLLGLGLFVLAGLLGSRTHRRG